MTRRQHTDGRRYGAGGKVRRVALAMITCALLLGGGTWAMAADLETGWDRPRQ